MVTEFPSNSRTSKEPPEVQEKNVERVVKSEVVRRKKPLSRRFVDIFVGGDARSVWGYVTQDVLVPAAKDMFADAVSQGVERMIFGEGRSRPGRRSGARAGQPYIAYNRYSGSTPKGRTPQDDRPQISRRGRASHDFDEIILNSRVEADEVIDRLFDLVSKYGTATVADLYDLVGVTGSYTDDRWGWTALNGAGVTRVRHGYLLDLPRPEPLD